MMKNIKEHGGEARNIRRVSIY